MPLRGGGTVMKRATLTDVNMLTGVEVLNLERPLKRQRRQDAKCVRMDDAESKVDLPQDVMVCPHHDGMTFTNPTTFKNHLRSHVKLNGKWSCKHCAVLPPQQNMTSVEFLTKRKLMHHIRLFHADVVAEHVVDGELTVDILNIHPKV